MAMLGQRFGHYLIEQKLGEGGMGVVYRARDEKLRRDVALKFLGVLPAGGSASHENVLQEARAISALNHPNICTIYEVGEIDGKPYIAMEYVEGRPLTMEISSTGMALDQVERYGMQLADALGHAHSRGIIHRDLKSANVIVTPQGRLKVLDFGISRRLDTGQGGSETTRFDKSWESQHTFTGTLPYVAPEVLKGEDGDTRSDIWSLGVLLYEMAAGRRPFKGGTAFELSAAILRERAPLITPPLPPILQSVIDRCLDKDPGQRYQSAGEVRAALEAATTSSRTHDYFTVMAQRDGNSAPSHATRNLTLVAFALLIAAGFGYWLYGKSASKRKTVTVGAIQSVAVLPLENLSGDPTQDYFAEGMTDALITELSQIKKLRVISRTSVMQYRHTQKPLQEIAQELNVDALVEGSVVRSGDRVRISAKLMQTNVEGALWADNFERKFTDVLALQSDVATAIARGIQVELSQPELTALSRSRSVVPEAYEAYLKGRYEAEKRTPEAFQDAERYFQKAVATDDTFAAAYAALADTYLNMSNYQMAPAGTLIPKAKEAVQKALQLDDRLAEAHTSLAAIRLWHLEGGEIESEFQRAIALDPGHAQSLHWYALYLAAIGRKEESIREIKLAREIDPKSLIINANVGFLYYLAGDYNHAEEAEKNTIRMDPSFSTAYSYLGQIYVAKKQYPEAIGEFRTAVSLSPGDIAGLADLAHGYAISGMRNEAEEILRGMQSAQGKKYVSTYEFAVIYAGFHDADKTLEWLEKGWEERNGRLVNLGVHPQFAFLQKDTRFQNIVDRIWGTRLIGEPKP
ncbi:MAG TPA: protein kinase [Candidatus Acidoferrum sp.]|jgi:serine/threonine-protein kinase|nr:protein kinase [Candidatus Acidoferrum sp.]